MKIVILNLNLIYLKELLLKKETEKRNELMHTEFPEINFKNLNSSWKKVEKKLKFLITLTPQA